MKKLAVTVIALGVLGLIGFQFSGLRRADSSIRSGILSATPLGSDPDAVLAVIRAKEWSTHGYVQQGFHRQAAGVRSELIGKSSIRASLGDYHGPPYFVFSTNVTAFWGFDENRRLIEVWIWRTTDAL